MESTEPQLAFQVTIPPGSKPGSSLRLRAPNGVLVDFVIPSGAEPGQVVQIEVPQIATPDADIDDEIYVPLPVEYWDITATPEAICCCISEKLIMGDQQLVWKKRNPCSAMTKRRPWAELGEIIEVQTPCGASILAPDMMGLGNEINSQQKSQQQGWSPGCPCNNQSTVKRIVAVLEERKAKRGHAAQNQKMDRLLRRVLALRGDLSATAPSSYVEQVSVDGLNATLNMTPLPYKEWNLLSYAAYAPPLYVS